MIERYGMVNKALELAKAELTGLGFAFQQDENSGVGRVPTSGELQGIYINVEICLTGFPLKMPKFRLISICEHEDLAKRIPPSWRHIDEFMESGNPEESRFTICCLHNWAARREYNGEFLYNRLYDWLNANVTGRWDPEQELPTWRLTPQIGWSTLYVPSELAKNYSEDKGNKPHLIEYIHSPYVFSNGERSSGKKLGNYRILSDVDFVQRYYFFPNYKDRSHPIARIADVRLPDKFDRSQVLVVPLPKGARFKTVYQLLRHISLDVNIKGLISGMQCIPVIALYLGDKGRTEALSFITTVESLMNRKKFLVQPLKTESLPNRPVGIDLSVGIIGVGTIGSQVARLLMEKDTRSVLMNDNDLFAAENIGRHVLTPAALGQPKHLGLATHLNWKYACNRAFALSEDKVIDDSDVLIVTVGNGETYDWFAFERLRNYERPVIWAWMSPNNLLQEIIITTNVTGCLNCYALATREDPTFQSFVEARKSEERSLSLSELDICGNPHTLSQMEKTVFLATQITSLLTYYSRHGRFPFDFASYYWGQDEIIPHMHTGFLSVHKDCFCQGEP